MVLINGSGRKINQNFHKFCIPREILDILKIVGLQVFDLIKDKSESYDGEEINIMHIFLKNSIFE